MNILVILAHPDKNSFNHAIAAAAVEALEQNGYKVRLHDLYSEGFDAILPDTERFKGAAVPPVIGRYCSELKQAAGIVIVHPNWWGQPPAILKGYIDRVFRPGMAYEFADGDSGEGIPVGLLEAKAALVFNTANTGAEREMETFGDPLETLWKNCIFGLCGIKKFHRRTFSIVVTSSYEQRQEWLREVQKTVADYFPAVTSSAQAF